MYDRLVKKLETVCKKYRSGKSNFQGFETLTMEINMSAKYQTPYVALHIESENYKIAGVGAVEDDVTTALDEVGFTYNDCEEKYGKYMMGFSD